MDKGNVKLKAFHMNDINEVWIGPDKETVRAAYMLNEDDCQIDEDEFYEIKNVAEFKYYDEEFNATMSLKDAIEIAQCEGGAEPFALCCDAAYA